MKRVKHRRTGATGTIQWSMPAIVGVTPTIVGVRWDDPLTSGPATVPRAVLEIEGEGKADAE